MDSKAAVQAAPDCSMLQDDMGDKALHSLLPVTAQVVACDTRDELASLS